MKNKFGFLETKDGNIFWFVLDNPHMTDMMEWDDFIRKQFIDVGRTFFFIRGHWDTGGDHDTYDIEPSNIKHWWTEEL